jgi:hypothetical protein
VIEVQDGVLIIPPQDAQGREIARAVLFREVRKRYVPMVGLAIGRYEKKVVEIPGCLLGFVGGLPLLEHEGAQDAAQDYNGKAFGFEVDKENAPWLVCGQRAKLPPLDPQGWPARSISKRAEFKRR